MRRPVPPGLAKPICDPPIREFEEPLEPSAILAPDSHSRVQAEALYAGALLPDPRLHVLDLDAIAESHHMLAGTQACGNAMPN